MGTEQNSVLVLWEGGRGKVEKCHVLTLWFKRRLVLRSPGSADEKRSIFWGPIPLNLTGCERIICAENFYSFYDKAISYLLFILHFPTANVPKCVLTTAVSLIIKKTLLWEIWPLPNVCSFCKWLFRKRIVLCLEAVRTCTYRGTKKFNFGFLFSDERPRNKAPTINKAKASS